MSTVSNDLASIQVEKEPGHYLSAAHPLFDAALRKCQQVHGDASTVRNGACGECWELVIRNDERVVVEHGLDRDLSPDPDFIDDIAVERALDGHSVDLTRAEEAELVRRQKDVRRGFNKANLFGSPLISGVAA